MTAPPEDQHTTTLTESMWQFRGNERTLSLALRFQPDGSLTGYDHPNERSWQLNDGELCFVSDKGRVTGRLAPYTLDDGRAAFRGRSLINPRLEFFLEQTDWENRGRLPQLTRTTLATNIERYGWVIGDHTYGTPQVFERTAILRIGKFVSMAAGVGIGLGNHRIDSVTSYPFPTLRKWWPSAGTAVDHVTRGDVVIGNDVWIGAGAFITSGVTVGDGAVIAGHAVVTKNVPPYAIVGGNPAKVLKYRFPPEIIERLLRLSWWDWPDQKVDRYLPLMFGESIEAFLEAAEAEDKAAGTPSN